MIIYENDTYMTNTDDNSLKAKKLAELNGNSDKLCRICNSNNLKELYSVEYDKNPILYIDYGIHCRTCALKLFNLNYIHVNCKTHIEDTYLRR